MAQSMERTPPKEGWSIILLETSPGNRTYYDGENIAKALETLVGIYEAIRKGKGLDEKNYFFADVSAWLDSLHQIQMMVYDKEINRYKRLDIVGIKKQLYEECQPDNSQEAL